MHSAGEYPVGITGITSPLHFRRTDSSGKRTRHDDNTTLPVTDVSSCSTPRALYFRGFGLHAGVLPSAGFCRMMADSGGRGFGGGSSPRREPECIMLSREDFAANSEETESIFRSLRPERRIPRAEVHGFPNELKTSVQLPPLSSSSSPPPSRGFIRA